MRRKSKIVKWLFRILIFFVGLILLLMGYLVWVSKINPPKITDTSALQLQRTQLDSNFFYLNNSWFRKSKTGLYELYIEAKNPFERGVVEGKLTKELVQLQEDYFSAQINKMIPSNFYRHFLKYFIGWFNRNLPQYVNEEFKEEIYGISFSASDHYGYIGDKYQRILNYHSAHDIGHALQNLMLVGCTSFGTWGAASKDSQLIIGRNFDFWVGDDFAKNKIIAFVNPQKGYKYMSVTWGGFVGVVSGMNEKGLTVTINAAKSGYPTGAATPVSIVAREIVQYAKNINEAIDIAKKRKMFVSESFLVGSAMDNKAVLIEKTPDSIAVFDPHQNSILCTNHFQSNAFKNSKKNIEQQENTATTYRYKRLNELLHQQPVNTVENTIRILRDYKGLSNSNIGIGNEKAVNQFIAHHSIVFEPQKLKVWVSTAPWQMGAFVCYDLNKIFSMSGLRKNREIIDSAYTVPADPFIHTSAFKNFMDYWQYKLDFLDKKTVIADSVVVKNPSLYNSYVMAGDISFHQKKYQEAVSFYQKALQLEIHNESEKQHILKQIKSCEEFLGIK